MKTLLLKNSKVEVGILEECGHLCPVRFFFDEDIIEPLNIAPWTMRRIRSCYSANVKIFKR